MEKIHSLDNNIHKSENLSDSAFSPVAGRMEKSPPPFQLSASSSVIQLVRDEEFQGENLKKLKLLKKLLSDSRAGYTKEDIRNIFNNVSHSSMREIFTWKEDDILALDWTNHALEILRFPERYKLESAFGKSDTARADFMANESLFSKIKFTPSEEKKLVAKGDTVMKNDCGIVARHIQRGILIRKVSKFVAGKSSLSKEEAEGFKAHLQASKTGTLVKINADPNSGAAYHVMTITFDRESGIRTLEGDVREPGLMSPRVKKYPSIEEMKAMAYNGVEAEVTTLADLFKDLTDQDTLNRIRAKAPNEFQTNPIDYRCLSEDAARLTLLKEQIDQYSKELYGKILGDLL